jgi:hypothetical protein
MPGTVGQIGIFAPMQCGLESVVLKDGAIAESGAGERGTADFDTAKGLDVDPAGNRIRPSNIMTIAMYDDRSGCSRGA